MRFKKSKLTDAQKQRIRDNFRKLDYGKLSAERKQYYNSIKGGLLKKKINRYAQQRVREAAIDFKVKDAKTLPLKELIRLNPWIVMEVEQEADVAFDSSVDTLEARFNTGLIKRLILTDKVKSYSGKRALKRLCALRDYYIGSKNRKVFGLILTTPTVPVFGNTITVTFSAKLLSLVEQIHENNLTEPQEETPFSRRMKKIEKDRARYFELLESDVTPR